VDTHIEKTLTIHKLCTFSHITKTVSPFMFVFEFGISGS